MAKLEVELLTDEANNAVVRLPGRKFPGILIQGDTLRELIATTSEAIEASKRGDHVEARQVLRELAAQLQEARARYEAALQKHNIELPY